MLALKISPIRRDVVYTRVLGLGQAAHSRMQVCLYVASLLQHTRPQAPTQAPRLLAALNERECMPSFVTYSISTKGYRTDTANLKLIAAFFLAAF